MASYLLALVVGEFDFVEKDTQKGVKVRGRRKRGEKGNFG